MDLGVSGRNALVTGASLGIGRAIAAELAANGVNVAMCARQPDRLQAAADEVTAAGGGRAVAVPGDLKQVEDVARVTSQAIEALGRIDILVNNAGSSPAGRLQDLDDDAWYSSFELKVMGYMRCCRALVPAMRERKWGRVVNIVGLGGHRPSAGYILGGSFNAAILNFTRALALDCAPDNVLVNAVNPGVTDTPRRRTLMEQKSRFSGMTVEEAEAESVGGVPLGRVGTSEDVAAAAAFLCSERAGHITGAQLNVDGGGAGGL